MRTHVGMEVAFLRVQWWLAGAEYVAASSSEDEGTKQFQAASWGKTGQLLHALGGKPFMESQDKELQYWAAKKRTAPAPSPPGKQAAEQEWEQQEDTQEAPTSS